MEKEKPDSTHLQAPAVLKIAFITFGLAIVLSACTTNQSGPSGQSGPAVQSKKAAPTAGPRPTNAQRIVRQWIAENDRNADTYIDIRISEPRIGTKWTGIFRDGGVPNWHVCVNFKKKHWLYGEPEIGPFIVWLRNDKVEYETHRHDVPIGTKHSCHSAKT